MKTQDKRKLAIMLDPAYKSMMQPIYREFKNYDSVEVRLEVIRWIEEHNHKKLTEQYGKRKYRRKKERKLKTELNMIKTKNEIDSFTDNLSVQDI